MRRALVLIVGLGLCVRVAWWALAHPDPVSDFEYYRRFGENLIDHAQLGYPRPSAMRVPGYPLFLAMLMVFSRSTAWLALANAVLSATLPLLVFLLAQRLTRQPVVALVAAALCAFDPTFVLFAPVLASEHLYAALLLASLILVLPDSGPTNRQSTRTFLFAGAIFGGAVLTRPETLFYLPVWLAVAWFTAAPMARRRLLAAMMLPVLMLAGGWWLRNRIEIGPGAGLSSLGGVSFYYGHNSIAYWYHPLKGTPLEGLPENERQTRAWELGADYIRHASAGQLWRDLVFATSALFMPGDPYGWYWSTRARGSTPDDYGVGPRGLENPFAHLIYWFNVALFAIAALSILHVRLYAASAWLVLYGVVFSSWFGYCVVFAAGPRYRYATDAVLCVLAAMTLCRWSGLLHNSKHVVGDGNVH